MRLFKKHFLTYLFNDVFVAIVFNLNWSDRNALRSFHFMCLSKALSLLNISFNVLSRLYKGLSFLNFFQHRIKTTLLLNSRSPNTLLLLLFLHVTKSIEYTFNDSPGKIPSSFLWSLSWPHVTKKTLFLFSVRGTIQNCPLVAHLPTFFIGDEPESFLFIKTIATGRKSRSPP